MTGTLINVGAVLVGGTLGMVLGARLPDRLRTTIVSGLGLFTLFLGVKMFFDTANVLIVLSSLLIGALLGEWWGIEEKLNNVGAWLEERTVKSGVEGSQALFVKGFLTASLVFCVGPMTFLGAIQDGLTGDYSLLAVKAVLDGFAALAFASSLGVGVLFSIIILLIYQGGLSLMAAQFQAIVTTEMMAEMSAVGGVILAGLAIGSLLEIRPIRTGSFLPALFIAPVLIAILGVLGLN